VAERPSDADVTISVSSECSRASRRGAEPGVAYMTGKLKISGDTGAALEAAETLLIPARSRASAASVQ
jgi:hypothetical protein